jgi:hypothetical protein
MCSDGIVVKLIQQIYTVCLHGQVLGAESLPEA